MRPHGRMVAIDARPRGPRGPLAAERVLGRSVLERLLDQAARLADPERPIAVHLEGCDQRLLGPLAEHPHPGGIVLDSGAPQAGVVVLSADRVYDLKRLRRGLARGRGAESAVIWRLDRPETLAAAEEELRRRATYQPLGSFWAFPIADRLSAWLRPTWVRPNLLTWLAAGFMFAAVVLVLMGSSRLWARVATPLVLAAGLVLDTADGRLARLQGTASAFGRWLDQVLDELVDLALHAAIAYAAYTAYHSAVWLLLGIAYASGKYLFLIQALAGEQLDGADDGAAQAAKRKRVGWARKLVHFLGHADLRWHLWIVLAAFGRLELALGAYAVYFPVRALLGIARKGVCRG